jgi:hypothetical protein
VFNDNGECQDIAMNSHSGEKEPFAPALSMKVEMIDNKTITRKISGL